ncbi:MAG TPA: MBL fold metallo-hydrolase [Deltaproteobacteria bacterium]|nr:MBL fold metallo-hydrolase [Deltaproteobacteria bacterium]HPR54606.1 MBL fold metallo-hydrolase [Deltaproteobacteria bacterium]HXK47262.1 MBL fold metallo-hydrolase [Deltaproteobacteria bacterium]
MRPTFLARLVNGPLFDPVVFVRLLNLRSAVLFDCGRMQGLSNREILSLESVFISHAHMDHFMGFDQVLRTILHRERPLHVYGPEGMRDRVAARLGSYTWNLTQGYPLELFIHEIREHETIVCSAPARDGFRPSEPRSTPRPGPTIAECSRYHVDSVILDHQVPCLCFVLKEPFHINMRAEALARGGYRRGPWIGEFKGKILAGCMDEVIEVPMSSGTRERNVAELMQELVVPSPGQKIAYVTDVRASAENIERIESIAAGADILFIEAYYLSEREGEAFAKAHLSARQAGMVARIIRAGRVVPMHVSPRYHERLGEVTGELEGARTSSVVMSMG